MLTPPPNVEIKTQTVIIVGVGGAKTELATWLPLAVWLQTKSLGSVMEAVRT